MGPYACPHGRAASSFPPPAVTLPGVAATLVNMSIPIPTHLAGHAIAEETDYGRRLMLRSSRGGTLFMIHYSGQRWQGFIVGDEIPALVIARALDTDETVVVFDGGRHGYDAMFVDEYDAEALDARSPDATLELDGSTAFALEIQLFDNISWDEEDDDLRDEAGVLRLISGEEISSDRLRADGYDAVGITAITPGGERFDIVSEELG